MRYLNNSPIMKTLLTFPRETANRFVDHVRNDDNFGTLYDCICHSSNGDRVSYQVEYDDPKILWNLAVSWIASEYTYQAKQMIAEVTS